MLRRHCVRRWKWAVFSLSSSQLRLWTSFDHKRRGTCVCVWVCVCVKDRDRNNLETSLLFPWHNFWVSFNVYTALFAGSIFPPHPPLVSPWISCFSLHTVPRWSRPCPWFQPSHVWWGHPTLYFQLSWELDLYSSGSLGISLKWSTYHSTVISS